MKLKKSKTKWPTFNEEALEQAETVKYDDTFNGKANRTKTNKLEGIKIPQNPDYQKIHALSSESVEKLHKIKPETIGQATRISGVSPQT